jgi:hypothetical protein
VEPQLRGGKASSDEHVDPTLDDSRRGAAPTGVEQRDRSRGVRQKDGHAVGDRHRQGRPTFDRHVAVRPVTAQPAFPDWLVQEHAVAMHLRRRGEPRPNRFQLAAQRVPAAHHLAHRLRALCAERANRAGCGKGLNAERVQVGDRLGLVDHAHRARRSSTRSIFAPSSRNRSSIRS